jgi:hypothetical protein
MACQYLYDNSIEDRGPDVIAFERFFELSASTKWDNMHEDDRLSLHTVSLCTSPATSSCKSTPHVESRRTITSPLTIDSGARSHSPNNSISSLDVTISMSPQHSPIQEREWLVQSLCPDSYLFRAAERIQNMNFSITLLVVAEQQARSNSLCFGKSSPRTREV